MRSIKLSAAICAAVLAATLGLATPSFADESNVNLSSLQTEATSGYEVSINGQVYTPTDMTLSAIAAPGCGTADAESKRVAVWQRRNPNGVALLQCGTSSWGWRHITVGKQASWQGIVTKYQLGGTWDEFAKWAMYTTLAAPSAAPVVPGDKWNYTAPIQIRNYKNGSVSREYTVLVSVARTTDRIITSFPS